MFKPCIVIPVYNHHQSIGQTLENIAPYQLFCFMVNDGSDTVCSRVLDELNEKYDWVRLLQHKKNMGKGAAVRTGLIQAFAEGFTHALQIDADGQHDLSDVPSFLRMSEKNPAAIITGQPLYDESVPKSRFYARYLTHVWVWINTLSLDIRDSMCGFRVYPLEAVVSLIKNETLSERMAFDTDVLVRCHWRGIEIINVPTRVRYPESGISHFHAVRDNVLISKMHARLFLGMLRRLPKILLRKFGG